MRWLSAAVICVLGFLHGFCQYGGIALAASAASAPRLIVRQQKCMGTLCAISAFHNDEHLVEEAAASAFAEMGRLEDLMTTWKDTSEVERINQAAGKSAVQVSPETFEVIEKSLWIAKLSGGAFDITMGAFAGVWKFDEDNDGSLPDARVVRARRLLVNHRDVAIDRGARTVRLKRVGQKINLGGIAKGYIVDKAVAKLRASGLRDFMVQAGGDFFASGRKGDRDWNVGIQDPRAPRDVPKSGATSFAVLSISDQAFNTSGDYERFVLKNGRRYHHIIDPKTGYPSNGCRSVTVLAPSAFLADTLDTAACVMGPKKGMAMIEEIPDVAAVFVDAKNRVLVSRRLKDKLKQVRPPTDGL